MKCSRWREFISFREWETEEEGRMFSCLCYSPRGEDWSSRTCLVAESVRVLASSVQRCSRSLSLSLSATSNDAGKLRDAIARLPPGFVTAFNEQRGGVNRPNFSLSLVLTDRSQRHPLDCYGHM